MNLNWDAATYDAKHNFVTKYGEELIELLNPLPGERILDIGCGTGHLTSQISERGATAIGLDASESMLEIARTSYPGIEHLLADASNFELDQKVDAVFSNAALHWIIDAESAVRCMSNCLRIGGRFVIEMGGRGNNDQIVSSLMESVSQMGINVNRPPKYYPSSGEYATLLEAYGILPSTIWFFERPTSLSGNDGLRNWYLQFAQLILKELTVDEQNEAIKSSENKLRATHFDGENWIADYIRLRIVAQKQ